MILDFSVNFAGILTAFSHQNFFKKGLDQPASVFWLQFSQGLFQLLFLLQFLFVLILLGPSIRPAIAIHLGRKCQILIQIFESILPAFPWQFSHQKFFRKGLGQLAAVFWLQVSQGLFQPLFLLQFLFVLILLGAPHPLDLQTFTTSKKNQLWNCCDLKLVYYL